MVSFRKIAYFALCFVAHPFKAVNNDAISGDMRTEMAATNDRCNNHKNKINSLNSHVKDLSDYRQASDYR